MKIAAWIGAFVAITLLVLLIGTRAPQMSAVEARSKIVALGDEPDINLVETKQHKGDAVLGSRIEKKLREQLHINQRETPCLIEDYHFRDSSGTFIVQLLDMTGESAKISVHGGPTESTTTGRLLRRMFPMADYGASP